MRPFEFLRRHIAILAALTMAFLALIVANDTRSLVIDYWRDEGVSHEVQAIVLLIGALMLIRRDGPEWFIAATLPLAIWIMTTVYITIDRRGGYATAVLYVFSYIELLALYGVGKARTDG